MSWIKIIALTGLLLAGCGANEQQAGAPSEQEEYSITSDQDLVIRDLMTTYKAPSLAIGVIKDGKLVITRYYGEQAPGIPVSKSTMFNTASMQKAITSETVMSLASKGLVELDESLSRYYIHPDIKDDLRHRKLTPRIVLTHKTGFHNWEHSYPDGKLAFNFDPGEDYEYSGIGFMIMARAIEKKLGKPWPQIVREEVMEPLGMTNSSPSEEKWMEGKYALPANAEGGFRDDFKLDYGYWNSADELYTTVEDYAKFLISVKDKQRLTSDMAAERTRVQSDLTENEIWGCADKVDPCPAPFGHGLGWFVFGYDGITNIQHGGNDKSEAAIGYIEMETGNGAVVLVNSTQGVLMWPKVVEVIDKEQKFTRVFNHVIDKYLKPLE